MLDLFTRPRHLPWVAVALAVLVLFPCLGSHGFWEPREIAVADSASRWLKQTEDRSESAGEETDDDAEPEPAEPPKRGKSASASGAEPGSSEPGAASEPGTPGAASEPGSSQEPGAAAEPGMAPEPPRATRPRKARDRGKQAAAGTEPRLTERLVALGIEHIGFDERGARLPLALLGFFAVMAAFGLGARVAGRRAGFLASMILLSFPLLVLQSRQLTSDIGAATGSALVMLGLAGLALPSTWSADGRPGWRRGALLALDVGALVLGAALALEAAGPLLGLVPPLGGFGVGALIWYGGERRPEGRPRPRYVAAVGGLALVGALCALAWFLYDTFTIAPAADGDRELFGRTLRASREAVDGLGAPWKIKGDPQTPFSAIFEQIAFGVFPWVAIAPLAVMRLALGRPAADAASDAGPATGAPPARSPAPWAGHVLFAWIALAWVIATIAVRKVAPVQYPAIVGIAVAVALWVDEILAARAAGRDDERGPGSAPLLALFGALAAIVVGKDLVSMPEELTALTATGVKFPEGVKLQLGIAPIAALFALSLGAGLFLWRGPYSLRWRRQRDLLAVAGRWGLHAAVAIGVVFAGFLAYVWLPGMAGRMSSRDVLEVYRERRQPGDQLGLLGNLGTGPSYYAGGDYVALSGRTQLLEFLAREDRVFALTRASELCPVHKEAGKRALPYYVLDDRNTQFLLFSNRLPPGEVDQNPLATAIRRAPPTTIQKKMSVNFDDQVELIGVNMPRRVGRGETFVMTLFYKVLKPVTRPWKIFVHVNAPNAPANINGDHAPIRGRCSMSYFQAGDYIVDTFEVKAGDVTFPKTTYKVFTGFFVGGGGNFTNMKALSGNPDEKNRVPIGSIQIR